MPIIERTGDLLQEPNLDGIVNNVNCVGVMGKGLALQIKLKFPKAFENYRLTCERGNLRPGEVHISPSLGPPTIIHAATKDHWRNPSQIHWIESCLICLEGVFGYSQYRRVAMTHLGCGLGGLSRKKVRPLIDKYLGNLTYTEILLF